MKTSKKKKAALWSYIMTKNHQFLQAQCLKETVTHRLKHKTEQNPYWKTKKRLKLEAKRAYPSPWIRIGRSHQQKLAEEESPLLSLQPLKFTEYFCLPSLPLERGKKKREKKTGPSLSLCEKCNFILQWVWKILQWTNHVGSAGGPGMLSSPPVT